MKLADPTVVAWYGAIVATGSLIVAFLAWRSQRPHIKVKAVLLGSQAYGFSLHFYVYNVRSTDVSVENIGIMARVPCVDPSHSHGFDGHVLYPVKINVEGDAFPYRLVGHSAQRWRASPEPLSESLGHRFGRGDLALAFVHLPSGLARTRVNIAETGWPMTIQRIDDVRGRLVRAWRRSRQRSTIR
jgi:hypothetical protein